MAMIMADELHHLVRMERHEDLMWSFGPEDVIELRPYSPQRSPDPRLDELCGRLGFEEVGDGSWRVPVSSPHYLNLWVFVEQDRLYSEEIHAQAAAEKPRIP